MDIVHAYSVISWEIIVRRDLILAFGDYKSITVFYPLHDMKDKSRAREKASKYAKVIHPHRQADSEQHKTHNEAAIDILQAKRDHRPQE